MRRQFVSNVAFYSTTAVLILIIVLCIGATVKSESRDETQRMENRIQEQQLMSDMKQYLNENGYRNSGVTLTYALEEDGSPDYTFTIHHKKINSMSETERGALSAELARACNAVGNYSVSYEYLLTDFYDGFLETIYMTFLEIRGILIPYATVNEAMGKENDR